MSFVVPDVCRFAINQSLDGRAVVNVLDMQIDTTGSTLSRNEAIEQQAEIIATNWVGDVFPYIVNDVVLNSVTFVDLNTPTGVTGEVVTTETGTLPQAAAGTASPLPSNAAVLVTKQVSSARGRRNGRMFVAGIGEDRTTTTNGNELDPTNQADLNSAFSAFLSGINQNDTSIYGFESGLVVVHVLTRGTPSQPGLPGPPLTGGYNVVTALAVQKRLATQRRRLRG